MSYQPWSQLDYLREGYADRGPEHTDWAYYGVADPDGTYRMFPLTPSRVEWWLQMECARHAGYSPREVYENWACDCRRERVEMAVD